MEYCTDLFPNGFRSHRDDQENQTECFPGCCVAPAWLKKGTLIQLLQLWLWQGTKKLWYTTWPKASLEAPASMALCQKSWDEKLQILQSEHPHCPAVYCAHYQLKHSPLKSVLRHILQKKHSSNTSFFLFLWATIFHIRATSNLFNWALSHLWGLCPQISPVHK